MFTDSPSRILSAAALASKKKLTELRSDIKHGSEEESNYRSSPTASGTGTAGGPSAVGELLDSWDDSEGYYKYRLGDILTDPSSPVRYRVVGSQGSGVFSTVLRVIEIKDKVSPADDHDGRELVVKMIRNNETMYKAGIKGKSIANKLTNQ